MLLRKKTTHKAFANLVWIFNQKLVLYNVKFNGEKVECSLLKKEFYLLLNTKYTCNSKLHNKSSTYINPPTLQLFLKVYLPTSHLEIYRNANSYIPPRDYESVDWIKGMLSTLLMNK